MSDNEAEVVVPPQPQPATEPVAAHLSVKPPPFDEVSAARWFRIMESNFILARVVNSATKFHHILSNLPVEVSNKLSDGVIDSSNYDTIKSAVIDLYSKSPPEIFDDLISQNNILCTKPSLYLQEIRKLGNRMNLSNEYLKVKFLKGLPSNVRMSLVTYDSDDLDELARVADMLLAYNTNSNFNAVHNVSSVQNRSNNANNTSHFVSRPNSNPIGSDSHLRHTSSNPNMVSNSNNTSQYTNPSVPPGIRAFHPNQRPQVCRAHLYFGHNARSCKSWCILSSSSSNILPDSRPSSPRPSHHMGN